MTKKQAAGKQTSNTKKERLLWIIIGILAISQAVTAWYLIQLWHYSSESSRQSMSSLIATSEQKRYKHPVIDITEGRVYIPEARVYLPLNETTRNLRYDYFNVPNFTSLRLSTSATVGVQIDTDDHACDKVVVLSQSKENMGATYRDSGEILPTKDGLRYLSVHNKDTCSVYYGSTHDDLAEAAKSIASY